MLSSWPARRRGPQARHVVYASQVSQVQVWAGKATCWDPSVPVGVVLTSLQAVGVSSDSWLLAGSLVRGHSRRHMGFRDHGDAYRHLGQSQPWLCWGTWKGQGAQLGWARLPDASTAHQQRRASQTRLQLLPLLPWGLRPQPLTKYVKANHTHNLTFSNSHIFF